MGHLQLRRNATLRGVALLGTLAAMLIFPVAASAQPRLFAASKQSRCLAGHSINTFLHANHASVMRLVLSPYWAEHDGGLACIAAAYNAHYKVYVSLQFSNRWTPRQDARYFARILPAYAPYLWALGVGNEQDLSSTVLPGQRALALSGAGYLAVWNWVEPVIARLAPHAIRVYGETTPWAFGATEQGFARGRPRGVQAIAAHCYHTRTGGLLQIPGDAAWAASKGLPLWCSEMGPALPRKTRPGWAVPDSLASWNRLVSRILAESSDLRMTSYYNSPRF